MTATLCRTIKRRCTAYRHKRVPVQFSFLAADITMAREHVSSPAIQRVKKVAAATFLRRGTPSADGANPPGRIAPERRICKEISRRRRERPAPAAKPPDTIIVRGLASPPTPPRSSLTVCMAREHVSSPAIFTKQLSAQKAHLSKTGARALLCSYALGLSSAFFLRGARGFLT